MLAASAQRILQSVPDDALVLDVGAGANAFPRADWVIDLMPYTERGGYGPPPDPAVERFDSSTWVERDICDRAPWPFADNQFDFVVCSHTLEDVRDPIGVCDELNRVGRAGYIEVPSRLEEQTYGIQGHWAGWSHHRWLVDLEGDELVFVLKHHLVSGRRAVQFTERFGRSLAPEERVHRLWWEGGFRYRERMFYDFREFDAYLADFVRDTEKARGRPFRPVRRPEPAAARARAAARRLRDRIRDSRLARHYSQAQMKEAE
jgi:hypothetical protein